MSRTQPGMAVYGYLITRKTKTGLTTTRRRRHLPIDVRRTGLFARHAERGVVCPTCPAVPSFGARLCRDCLRLRLNVFKSGGQVLQATGERVSAALLPLEGHRWRQEACRQMRRLVREVRLVGRMVGQHSEADIAT